MYSYIVISIFLILTLYFLRLAFKEKIALEKAELLNQQERLKKTEEKLSILKDKIILAEKELHSLLTLYEINRRISGILNSELLLRVFLEELRHIKEIKKISVFSRKPEDEKSLNFEFNKAGERLYLSIKCEDEKIRSQLPILISQFKLLMERTLVYSELQRLSLFDNLTQLPNRRYFISRFEEEFNRSEKFNLTLSFLMVDIDFFKNYNDTYGHLVGDALLKEVAQILRSNLREIDFLGRFGGEEFAVFLPQTSKEEAIYAAERVRKAIEKEEFSIYDERLRITVSIGVSNFPLNSRKKDGLIEVADKALYRAKHQGRNKVCYF